MRLIALLCVLLFVTPLAVAQKQMARSPRILNAKNVYFLNRTGTDAVGTAALAQLNKWGKYKVVPDRAQADLILYLSASPYHDGDVVLASGQTGTIQDNGHIAVDPVPNFPKAPPTRFAYLAVLDAKTGENLWSDEHAWGGLLTGYNSVGARLVHKLETQTKH